MHLPPVPRRLRAFILATCAAWIVAGCAGPARYDRAPAPPEAAPATAADSVRPGINDSYLDPDLDVSQWVERFEREGREVYDHREALVLALDAAPGMAVADIGAGSGLFTTLIAERVGPSGRVYAVDIARPFVEAIEGRADAAGLDNIEGVVCTERSVSLPPGSIDRAFICDTYHHFEYPAETMASLHRALRENGEVLVIDFHRIPGTSSEWVMDHVRAGQEVVTTEIEAAGFRKIGELSLLKDNYVLRFRRESR